MTREGTLIKAATGRDAELCFTRRHATADATLTQLTRTTLCTPGDMGLMPRLIRLGAGRDVSIRVTQHVSANPATPLAPLLSTGTGSCLDRSWLTGQLAGGDGPPLPGRKRFRKELIR